MNKEQAIEIIERHIDNNIASGSLVEQALSMSIDALKAQLFQEGKTKDTTSDTISKTETVEHLRRMLEATVPNTDYDEGFIDGVEFGISTVQTMPSAQPEQQHGRVFKGIVVKYQEYCIYPEYKGKPYFSIKYTENGQEFIGYSTYKLEVLSEYLKEYFMSSAQPERI